MMSPLQCSFHSVTSFVDRSIMGTFEWFLLRRNCLSNIIKNISILNLSVNFKGYLWSEIPYSIIVLIKGLQCQVH